MKKAINTKVKFEWIICIIKAFICSKEINISWDEYNNQTTGTDERNSLAIQKYY